MRAARAGRALPTGACGLHLLGVEAWPALAEQGRLGRLKGAGPLHAALEEAVGDLAAEASAFAGTAN